MSCDQIRPDIAAKCSEDGIPSSFDTCCIMLRCLICLMFLEVFLAVLRFCCFKQVAFHLDSFSSLQLGRILHQCLPVSIAWKHRRQEVEHRLRYRWCQQDRDFERLCSDPICTGQTFTFQIFYIFWIHLVQCTHGEPYFGARCTS